MNDHELNDAVQKSDSVLRQLMAERNRLQLPVELKDAVLKSDAVLRQLKAERNRLQLMVELNRLRAERDALRDLVMKLGTRCEGLVALLSKRAG